MPKRIDTPDYWIGEFKPTSKDMDALYEFALEASRPLGIEELAGELVRQHVERLTAAHRSRDGGAAVYLPSDRFEKGQRLVFPAMGGATGTVQSVRSGNNPAYGQYEVIGVDLGAGQTREFAAGITWEHALTQAALQADPEALAAEYAPLVAPRLADELHADAEWAGFGNRWVLKALLPKVDKGHRNLAEAVIMLAGEALPTERIAEEIDLPPDPSAELRDIALDIALHGDSRFRNVGAHESPLWALRS
jgi:hypothetical protein